MGRYELRHGDCRALLAAMPDESVNACVTSPPYWGLRDYGHDTQIGLEKTPEEYVTALVDVFREVRRVLRDDGVLWLNLGDSYAAGGCGTSPRYEAMRGANTAAAQALPPKKAPSGLKPKDLVGIPWRVAFALQADGWYLRADVIWHKPNPMPESVRDRPTKAHEYVFLLTKSARYYYDAEALREPATHAGKVDGFRGRQGGASFHAVSGGVGSDGWTVGNFRNRRSVWTIATQPYKGAHFAVMPLRLAEDCVQSACPVGGVVLDPFCGAGTTGVAAVRHGRQFIGLEAKAEYMDLARERLAHETRQGDLFALASKTP